MMIVNLEEFQSCFPTCGLMRAIVNINDNADDMTALESFEANCVNCGELSSKMRMDSNLISVREGF